jgi:TRAP-type C4-dicarboxylate transport system substrate-binding protein
MLFKDAEELDALQLGSVQMLAPVPGTFGPAGLPEFEVFDLPYMFPDLDALHRVHHGPAGVGPLKKLDGKGMVGLAFWDNDFGVMSANRPIHVPDDMKGLKMRIDSSKVNAASMRSVGAMSDATALNDQVALKDEAAAIAGIKASGKSEICVPTPAEKEAWTNAMRPVQDQMASRVKKGTIAAVREAVAGGKK